MLQLSFLDSKEHDFMRVWQSETGKGWQIDRMDKELDL